MPTQRKASSPPTTDSGPAGSPTAANADATRLKAAHTQALVAGMPFNSTKPGEHGFENALKPAEGDTVEALSRLPSASTATETNGTDKTGSLAVEGLNPGNDSLDRVRVDSIGRPLTTNQGVLISDNQNSLKDGLRGPVLLEDFVLREKITHFDHERIPERIVHARGSAAHGYFESYGDLSELTAAAPFEHAGKRTPVFVRFSTVAGERGS